MKVEDKVIAAITTAVQMYMQAEQVTAVPLEPAEVPAAPGQAISLWALSGRQSAMETRRFWQMRLAR